MLVIEELHAEHQSMSRMKSLGRSLVWWPNMDADVEECVKSVEECVKRCEVCQAHQKVPAAAPLHPWEWLSCHGAFYMQTMLAHS